MVIDVKVSIYETTEELCFEQVKALCGIYILRILGKDISI